MKSSQDRGLHLRNFQGQDLQSRIFQDKDLQQLEGPQLRPHLILLSSNPKGSNNKVEEGKDLKLLKSKLGLNWPLKILIRSP